MNGSAQTDGSQPMGGVGQDEAGSSDNRLTLSPDAFGGFAQDWEDGQSYDMTIKVQQVSPGEFIVMDAKESETPAEDAGEGGQEEEAQPAGANAASKGGGSYPNPAVDRMMRGMKR